MRSIPFRRGTGRGIACFCSLTVLAPALAQENMLEEVIVTATAMRENPLDIAQPTLVLGGDDLRRQIAGSIGETLAQQPGISSTYFGPTASRPVIRGLGGDRVLMLEDGLPALDVSGLSQDHAVSVEAVIADQVEVLKGPAALLYGGGAAGGLVNVVSNRVPTQRADARLKGAAEARMTTATGERTGAVRLDGDAGVLTWHGDWFSRDTDDVRIPGVGPDGTRGRIANSASEGAGGAAGVSYVGTAGSGGIGYSRYENTYGIPVEEAAFIDMKQDRLDFRGEWRPKGDTGGDGIQALKLRGARNDYTHTEFEAPGEPGTLFDQDAWDLRLSADHRLGGWRGTMGAQMLDVDFAAVGDEAYVPPSQTRMVGLFAFQERHFDLVTLELGARFEQQEVTTTGFAGGGDLPDYDANAFSLSGGVVWRLADERTLAVNITRTARHPQAAELYANGPHLAAGRVEIGDPTLDVEHAITADLSLRGSAERLRYTLTVFYNDYEDYIYLAPTGTTEEIGEDELLPVYAVSQAGARLHGYEAELIFPVDGAGPGTLEFRLASDYVRGRLKDGGDLPQMPALRYGGGVHYELDRWHGGLEAMRYDDQEAVAAEETPTPGYTALNADLSYRWPLGGSEAFLFLRGANLLDEDARQASSILKDRVPLPGRSLSAGVRLSF